jgi:hypothetical protein
MEGDRCRFLGDNADGTWVVARDGTVRCNPPEEDGVVAGLDIRLLQTARRSDRFAGLVIYLNGVAIGIRLDARGGGGQLQRAGGRHIQSLPLTTGDGYRGSGWQQPGKWCPRLAQDHQLHIG